MIKMARSLRTIAAIVVAAGVGGVVMSSTCYAQGSESRSVAAREYLAGEWLFNADVSDASGRNADCVNRGVTFVADRFGRADGAGYFDGNSSVDCAVEKKISLDADFSVALWIKGTASTQKPITAIISKGHGGEYGFKGWTLQRVDYENDGNLAFGGGNGKRWVTPATLLWGRLLDGAWHFVVATNSGGKSCLFLDGKMESLAVADSFVGSGLFHLTIGADTVNKGRNFTGAIDDIRIYRIPLTNEQVAQLYRAGLSGAHDGNGSR